MNISKKGIGLNLRLEYIDDILREKPNVPFFEIIADNWLSDGPHHAKLEKLRKEYDIFFHCVGMNLAGSDPLNLDYLVKIENLKSKYQPLHVSDHICLQAHNGQYFHDLLPFPFNQKFLDHLSSRINEVQTFFKESILLENLSYYVTFKDSDYTEVDFINSLVKSTDSYLLLDLNNIWVNELNLDIKTLDYLAELDFSRVREIHVAGPEKSGNVYVDTHGGFVSKEVLALLKSTLLKYPNLPVIYERDTNLPSFNTLLDQRFQIEQQTYK